jgi:hypothetical protein
MNNRKRPNNKDFTGDLSFKIDTSSSQHGKVYLPPLAMGFHSDSFLLLYSYVAMCPQCMLEVPQAELRRYDWDLLCLSFILFIFLLSVMPCANIVT